MTAAFLCGIAALFLIVVGLFPLAAAVSWDKEGFAFSAGLPFVPERPAAAGKRKKVSPKRPDWPIMQILAKNGYTILCRIAARLRVDELTLHFTAASPDPAAAAAAYAAAALAMDALSQLGGERLANADLRADVDFDADEPELLLYIRLSIRVYRLLAAAAVFGFGFLRDYIRYKKGK